MDFFFPLEQMKYRPIPTKQLTFPESFDDVVRLDESSFIGIEENEELERIWKSVRDAGRRDESLDWLGVEEEDVDELSYDPYERWIEIDMSDYQFEVDNPYLRHEFPFEEASKLLERGDITMAVLALEAAVQQDPQNSDLWLKLGTTQAENEKEQPAITALRISIKLNPNNLPAWMVNRKPDRDRWDFVEFGISFFFVSRL